MIRDARAVQRRSFVMPMDWASDAALLLMRSELAQEIAILHPSVVLDGSKRNGLWYVEREINWRGLAALVRDGDSQAPARKGGRATGKGARASKGTGSKSHKAVAGEGKE